jgi:hypothetical protein
MNKLFAELQAELAIANETSQGFIAPERTF